MAPREAKLKAPLNATTGASDWLPASLTEQFSGAGGIAAKFTANAPRYRVCELLRAAISGSYANIAMSEPIVKPSCVSAWAFIYTLFY